MKIGIQIGVGIIILAGIAVGVLAYMNRPISEAAVTEKIEQHVTDVLEKNETLSSVLLTISSDQTGYLKQFAAGTTNRSSAEPARTDSQYHSASIGKTMCAVVYGLLVDQGIVSYEDHIDTWLDADILKELFVIDGIDYSDQVTLQHLLSHTSEVVLMTRKSKK